MCVVISRGLNWWTGTKPEGSCVWLSMPDHAFYPPIRSTWFTQTANIRKIYAKWAIVRISARGVVKLAWAIIKRRANTVSTWLEPHPPRPQLEKLDPQIQANVYGGNRPSKTLCWDENRRVLYFYDVYWLVDDSWKRDQNTWNTFQDQNN
jgi:hypothetical protein